MTDYYKRYTIIDRKPRLVIVDETGSIVNKNPSKEELEGLREEVYIKKVKVCCNCGSHGTYVDPRGYKVWHQHKCQKMTCTKYLCNNCYQRYDPSSTNNIIKSLANIRTGNQDPNHSGTKADKSQELACELYGWIDLNKENDNHISPLDCVDLRTGLYHQVQGRCYNYEIGYWPFGNLEREWKKKFEDMVCFCFNEDWKIVERIYKFLREEIMRVKSISVYKNPSRGVQWYEKYRVEDKDELDEANKKWKDITVESQY